MHESKKMLVLTILKDNYYAEEIYKWAKLSEEEAIKDGVIRPHEIKQRKIISKELLNKRDLILSFIVVTIF